MYLEHFGLSELPFRITPHTDFFFSGANRGPTLQALMYAIGHDEGIVKVSGEVGSGKTMMCRVLMERLPAHVDTILLSNPSIAREEILYAIADELKLDIAGERQTALLRILHEHLIDLYAQNRRVVVLIDEAHAMPQETLEQIRLLSNLESSRAKLLQIVLFGQPELDEHLNTPQMRQLKERITQSFRLDPLARSDIEAYLDFRMRAAGYHGPSVFSRAAVRQIVKASKGHTRRVNILADKSLLAAFADNTHGISAKHVARAIRDSEFYKSPVRMAAIWLAAAGLAAGLALGLVLPRFLAPATAPAASPMPAAPVRPATPAAAAIESQTAPKPPDQPDTAGTPSKQQQSDAIPATGIAASATSPAHAPVVAASAPVASAQTASTVSALAPAAATRPVLTAAPASATPLAATSKKEPSSTTIAATPGSMDFVPPVPAAGRLTRERFAATQEWLKSAPGNHYSIQLITAGGRDLRHIEGLLARAPKQGLDLADFHVYGVKIDDDQYYRLAYGLYPSVADLRQGLDGLPPAYKEFRPFHRSVERMRSQNRQ